MMQGISLSINRLRNFYCNNSRGILESLGFNLWKLYSISLRAANNKLSTTGVSYLDLANLKMAKSKLAMCLLPEATANVLSFYQVMRQASDWATNECQEPGSLRMPVSPYRWIKELAFGMPTTIGLRRYSSFIHRAVVHHISQVWGMAPSTRIENIDDFAEPALRTNQKKALNIVKHPNASRFKHIRGENWEA